MKNLKKRIERLEKILKSIEPLEEPVVTLDLTFEQRQSVRDALTTLEIKDWQMLSEEEEKCIPRTPPTEEQKKRLQEVHESLRREAKEREKDKKI